MSKSKNESNKTSKNQLFVNHPSQNYHTRIVRVTHFQEDLHMVMAYQDAANRLANSFRGRAKDDLLLMPFLYLYRHAFELLLKHMLRLFVSLRVQCIDGVKSDLEKVSSDEYLKKSLGHNLHKILEKVESEYEKLQVDSPFPAAPKKLIMKIQQVDINGESFRYPHQLGDEEYYINFNTLNQEIKCEFDTLMNFCFAVDSYFAEVPNLDE